MFSPEVFFPILARIGGVLDECGIRYQLTGGLVAVYYVEPRLTQDADLVIDRAALQANLDRFLRLMRALGYLVTESVIRDSAASGRMFQVIDPQECIKVDFYPREIIPGALERSIWVELSPGLSFPLAALADIVASKLIWISKGSHKSRRDVKQLMRRANPSELRMVDEFVTGLQLTDLLKEVLAEPDEIDF